MSTLQRFKDQFSQAAGLPFADVLSEERILPILEKCGIEFRDRVFNPIVTLWAFLSQCLSQDGSCRDAASRVAAHRAASGLKVNSVNPCAYSKACGRLDLRVIQKLSRDTARTLEKSADDNWKWKGRSVLIVDGSTLSMQDTEELQEACPQPKNQKPGLGFPLMRIAAVFSFSTGCVIDIAFDKYKGKKTGEGSLFRRMIPRLPRGSVVMGDKYYDNFWSIAYLSERAIDVVFRSRHSGGGKPKGDKPAKRYGSIGKTNFTEIGDGDRLFVWNKPQRPKGMSKVKYDHLPNRIWMREIVVELVNPKGRAKTIKVITTLTDHRKYTKEDIIELYGQRWNCELDLRNLKTTMGLEILRCKSVDMVHKELWAHILAYNCLKSVAASAAKKHDVKPRQISFKGTVQTILAFAPALQVQTEGQHQLLDAMLLAIASPGVGNRPGRWEPRAVKRRPKPQRLLTVPREVTKRPLMRELWS